MICTSLSSVFARATKKNSKLVQIPSKPKSCLVCIIFVTLVFSDSAMEKLEALKKEFKETEDDLKYLTTTRVERIGEIVKPLDKKRCKFLPSLIFS